MASRSEKLYADTPELSRSETGKVEVKKAAKTTNGKPMTEGDMPTSDRHAAERREMHHRHMAEHNDMHARHEGEHSRAKGDKGAMHDRHEGEMKEMHRRHESEFKAMHDRHEKEGTGAKPAGKGGDGAAEISKVEKVD